MWPAGIRLAGRDQTHSRPCKYSLGLQDDSVFADFDIDEDGCVVLTRISFDGFGCCPTRTAIPMNLVVSERFIQQIEDDNVSTQEFAKILENYFKKNEDVIWKDALNEHGLLPR